MFGPPEALLSHTLSKSYYLINKLFPTNLLLFQEPVNVETPYLPLPFLNPTTYLPSNLTSTNWTSSPYLINFPFSFFLCQAYVIGSIGLPLTLFTKKNFLPIHLLLSAIYEKEFNHDDVPKSKNLLPNKQCTTRGKTVKTYQGYYLPISKRKIRWEYLAFK